MAKKATWNGLKGCMCPVGHSLLMADLHAISIEEQLGIEKQKCRLYSLESNYK